MKSVGAKYDMKKAFGTSTSPLVFCQGCIGRLLSLRTSSPRAKSRGLLKQIPRLRCAPLGMTVHQIAHCRASGFSLAEVLTALTIGAMVLVAVLVIYGRAERSAAAVTRKLDSSRLPSEVLQRIAEDLDGIISTGSDTKITIENKFKSGLPTARLTITSTFHDSKNKEQTFEKIVWQSNFDFESGLDGLVLYRSHSGIALEDKLLDKNKDDWERELFVPICTGITFFRIRVPRGDTFLDRWTSSSLPPGIEVAISAAEPFKKANGTLDVPDEEKITRTIAIDRTRKIKFSIEKRDFGQVEDKEQESVPLSDGKPSPSGKTPLSEDPKKTKEIKR